MAKRVIYAGVTTNDGKGDTLKVGAQKINDNFTELYTALGADTGSLSVVSGLVAGDGITVSSPAGQVTVTSKIATDVVLGGVKIGDNLNITEDGVLSANPGNYSLPVATGGTLGGVKVTGNDGIAISGTGVISVTPYSLPTATSTVLGAIKVGARLAITDGVLSATDQAYTLPKATDFSLGGVIVDGSTIAINSNGVISVLAGGGTGTIDRLTNGAEEVVIEEDGSITFPTLTTINWEDGTLTGPTLQMGNDPTVTEVVITGPTPTNDYSSARRLIIQGQQGFGGENNSKGEGGDVYIWAGSGGDAGAIDPRGDGGDVKLRAGQGGNNGGYIRLESGDAQAENGTGGFLDLNAGNSFNTGGYGGHVNIRAGNGEGDGSLTGGNVRIYTNSGFGTWEFKPDGSFALNNNEVHIATNNWGRTAPVNVNTVVYTAKQSNLASIRVHATFEGTEDGDTTGRHSQACDMMIVRRQADSGASTVDSVVYGVIYTGTGPLATLDAQWNAVTGKIEITATPISTTNDVYVKIYATEVARGD